MGRPKRGALSSYPLELVDRLRLLRERHEGWGATNLLVELEVEHDYDPSTLPSIASVNRYLKQEGFIQKREPSSDLPRSKGCDQRAKRPHDVWQLDAQGAVLVDGIGHIAMINIKDVKSRIHGMAFPVPVGNANSQPSKIYYYWALRLAFMQWGLPKLIQVDNDSVFRDNASKSPFPQKLHLWLLSLGVELCFIEKPPPAENSMVERAHQTMERQVLMGQHYQCWKQLFQYSAKRLERMNHKLPHRLLNKQAPLQAYPKAIHSGRHYELTQEHELIKLKKVNRYLATCTWFRLVSKSKSVSLAGQVYYLKNAQAGAELQIHFCNRAKKLMFRDANELMLAKAPIKNLSVEQLMGATPKNMSSIFYKLYNRRDCPL